MRAGGRLGAGLTPSAAKFKSAWMDRLRSLLRSGRQSPKTWHSIRAAGREETKNPPRQSARRVSENLLGNSKSSLAVFYVEQVALNRHVSPQPQLYYLCLSRQQMSRAPSDCGSFSDYDLSGRTLLRNRGPGRLHKCPNDFQKHGPHDYQHHEPSRLRAQSTRYLTIDGQAQTRISEIRCVHTNQTSARRRDFGPVLQHHRSAGYLNAVPQRQHRQALCFACACAV